MRIKSLKIKDIRSYEEQEIFFPEGSLLLAGDIGSGKSTLLLAIEYALFGLQPGQRGSSLLRNNQVSGEVTLNFEIGGKDIIIERKLKRNKKSITNEYSAITIDGEKIESSTTEIKTKIIDLLGYPQEYVKKNNVLYKYTIYTPQESMKQIISEDPDTRLNILRHIFGVDKYKTIRENLTILQIDIKEKSKILQFEISDLDSIKQEVLNMSDYLSDIDEKISSKSLELEEQKRNLESIEKDILELENKNREREEIFREIEKAKVLISAKKETLRNLLFERKNLESLINSSEKKFNQLEYDSILKNIESKYNEISALNLKISSFKGEIQALSNLKNTLESRKERVFKIDLCPTCLQDVPERHKHNIFTSVESEISKINSKISSLEKDLETFMLSLRKFESEKEDLDLIKKELEEVKIRNAVSERNQEKINDLIRKLDYQNKDIDLLENHLTKLKETLLDFSKYETLFRLKKEELRQKQDLERNTAISLAEFKKELELRKKQISDLGEKIIKKEAAKVKLHHLQELNNWLSNNYLNLIDFIERNVLIKLRQEFSNFFSKWFTVLVPEGSFSVNLDENFSPIITHSEVEMDYSDLSGGERTALALAYRLSLNQTINSIFSKLKTTNLIILDEPTEGFSELQLDKMRDILLDLNASQIILVSHESKIESFVDHIIRVKKESGISKIEKPL